MNECTFCRIISGSLPGQIVYRDEIVTAFRDIHPAAPTHVLIVPNQHITMISEMKAEEIPIIGHMFHISNTIAKQEGIDQSGYRLIVNNGPDGGQVIYHLHLHLIGGQRMRYPMG